MKSVDENDPQYIAWRKSVIENYPNDYEWLFSAPDGKHRKISRRFIDDGVFVIVREESELEKADICDITV